MGQSLFSLLRPAYESTPELATLASQARAENKSSDALERQIEFDDKVAQELSSLKLTDSKADAFEIPVVSTEPECEWSELRNTDEAGREAPQGQSLQGQPEEESKEERTREEEPTRRARPRTILFAVGVGLIATVCMVIFLISDRLNSFEGADRISELLDSANNLTGDEFEAVETKAGDLQDWFFLKHGLEHYAVPKQFANIKTVGCRVFKFDGATVAQIMAVTDKEVLLYMFPSHDLGIRIRKGKWEIVEDEKWVGGRHWNRRHLFSGRIQRKQGRDERVPLHAGPIESGVRCQCQCQEFRSCQLSVVVLTGRKISKRLRVPGRQVDLMSGHSLAAGTGDFCDSELPGNSCLHLLDSTERNL